MPYCHSVAFYTLATRVFHIFWSAIKLLAATVTVTVVVFVFVVAVAVTAGVMLLYSPLLLLKSATDIFNNCDAHPTHLENNTYLHMYVHVYVKQLIYTHTHAHTSVYACKHVYNCTYMHKYILVCMCKSHLIVGIYLLILICLCVCP